MGAEDHNVSHLLLSRVVDQASMVTSSAICRLQCKYGKNVTGVLIIIFSDGGDVNCSSEDEVLLDPWVIEIHCKEELTTLHV